MRSCLSICLTVWEVKKNDETVQDWLGMVRDAGVYLETDKLIANHKKMTKLIPLETIKEMID